MELQLHPPTCSTGYCNKKQEEREACDEESELELIIRDTHKASRLSTSVSAVVQVISMTLFQKE